MNIKSLSMALRNKATELSSVAAELGEVDATTAQQDQTLRDASELICVLARMGEGKPMNKAFGAPGGHGSIPGYLYAATPHEHYRHIWESINGAGSWDKNPWVWVVEFKRIEPPKGRD